MNLYNVKNIKDLPQLEQILPGNFLVVENFTGTNKLDFDDFVIGPRNTSFANQVFTDILAISSYCTSTVSSQISSLSSQTLSSLNTFNSLLTTLSSETVGNKPLNNTDAIQGLIKMAKKSVALNAGSNTNTVEVILPRDLSFPLQNSDIHVVPSEIYPISLDYIWYISSTFDNNVLNTTAYTITLSANSINNSSTRLFDVTVIAI
jgi:hypothetical protein